jgi:hypothetical protein
MLSYLRLQSLGRYAPVDFLKHGGSNADIFWKLKSMFLNSKTTNVVLQLNELVATLQNRIRGLSLTTAQEIQTAGIGAFPPIVSAPRIKRGRRQPRTKRLRIAKS